MIRNKKTNKRHKIYGCIYGLLLTGVFVFASAGAVYAEASANASANAYAADASANANTNAYAAEANENTDAGSSYYPEKEHADMDYADMVYTSVDPQALDDLIAELDGITDGTNVPDDPEQRTAEIYHEMLQIMNSEYTHYVLGDLKHYMNVNDEDMSEKNRQDTLAIQDMSDAAYISLQKALTGSYGSELREELSDDQTDELEEYEALTERERELTDKEMELQQKYDRLSEEDYSFEYKGKTWTLDDLNADPPEDYDDIEAVYFGITKAMNDALVPVFQEMVETRKEIAELEGYDTYTDYCYDVSYGRDFTGEDIAALRETIIRELKPVYEELRMIQYMDEYNTELEEPLTGDQIVDTIGERIGNVHPELTEAFDYMREHGLYCIDNTDDMLDVGFTSDLPEYGSAFIFDKTNGTVHDLETTVHEFGHFNAAYHAEPNVLMDSLLVDVAEIQSQGLEMLFLDEMKEILPDDPEGLQLYLLMTMLDSVLTGFEYDEFQQEVYAGDEMTQEELNKLAMDIDEKYSQYFYDDNGEAYEWVMINHTFTSPLYYIGYATSALSALDIWTESMEDRDAAIDKYMKLSAVPLDMPYQEAITSCGLRNMLEPESISELADEIRELAGLDSFGGFNEFGFPEFGAPFGFGEEDPFGFGELTPFGFGEESPFGYGELTPVEPYGDETTPGGSGTQPGGNDSQSGGNGSHSDGNGSQNSGSGSTAGGGSAQGADEFAVEVSRQAFRVFGFATAYGVILRIAVLVIALAAYFKKKNGGRGGDGFDGPDDPGNWNGPNGPGSWNDPNVNNFSNWNSQSGQNPNDRNSQYGQIQSGQNPNSWNNQFPNGWNNQRGQDPYSQGQNSHNPNSWNNQYPNGWNNQRGQDPYSQDQNSQTPNSWNSQYGQSQSGQNPNSWNSQCPNGWNNQRGQDPYSQGQPSQTPNGWNSQFPNGWNNQRGQDPYGQDQPSQTPNSWNSQYGQSQSGQNPNSWNSQYPNGWNNQRGQDPYNQGQPSQTPNSWNSQYGQSQSGQNPNSWNSQHDQGQHSQHQDSWDEQPDQKQKEESTHTPDGRQ